MLAPAAGRVPRAPGVNQLDQLAVLRACFLTHQLQGFSRAPAFGLKGSAALSGVYRGTAWASNGRPPAQTVLSPQPDTSPEWNLQ